MCEMRENKILLNLYVSLIKLGVENYEKKKKKIN